MDFAAPFDGMAADYDRSFTSSTIGRRMRAAVWRRMDATFQPGERVLELNCGTGEDAVHLGQRGVRVVATDSSPEMLAMTRAKVEHAGLTELVEVARLPIEDLAKYRPAHCFDGVLSNFGGLNCVADLPAVSRGLAALTRPGARALLCAMGPAVPWEWGWYLVHGQPRKAVRRLGRQGAHDGLRIDGLRERGRHQQSQAERGRQDAPPCRREHDTHSSILMCTTAAETSRGSMLGSARCSVMFRSSDRKRRSGGPAPRSLLAETR